MTYVHYGTGTFELCMTVVVAFLLLRFSTSFDCVGDRQALHNGRSLSCTVPWHIVYCRRIVCVNTHRIWSSPPREVGKFCFTSRRNSMLMTLCLYIAQDWAQVISLSFHEIDVTGYLKLLIVSIIAQCSCFWTTIHVRNILILSFFFVFIVFIFFSFLLRFKVNTLSASYTFHFVMWSVVNDCVCVL